ncbi:Protein tyrosine phosphatase type IVA 1 [Entomortierella beljakovae]|nr:Protein tyrosine phosphatase type IVA 1 [Entomortierella beljakovae]
MVNPQARLLNRPVLIEYKSLRFLISDAPSDSNLPLYIAEFVQHNTKDVVRVCDPTYVTTPLEKLGIKVHDCPFTDGEGPPPAITRGWLDLVKMRFGEDQEKVPKCTIAVHCVAGLGRAPLLVAIALIEAGMTPEESISFLRERRRGVLNTKQAKFILEYKRKKKSRTRNMKAKCIIM